MIKSLFTVPIFQQKLNLNLHSIEKYCLSEKQKNKVGRTRSNKGGWQSKNLKITQPELNNLILDIENSSKEFCKLLKLKSVVLQDIWININNYNCVNIPHLHPGSILSGVFYVKVPKNGGNIRFQRPGYDSFNCIWPDKKDNSLFLEMDETNSPEWWMPSMNNILYIFPSWLSHWVEPNLNKKENRISISFNMV